jgi:hypothetical protein
MLFISGILARCVEWHGLYHFGTGPGKRQPRDYAETFKVSGWENVQVQAGNFKAIEFGVFPKEFYQKIRQGILLVRARSKVFCEMSI